MLRSLSFWRAANGTSRRSYVCLAELHCWSSWDWAEQTLLYASSSAFLDEYFNTTLLPFTTSIEQSITRDLIPRKQWGTLYAKHSADIILRGSPKERAETNQVLINSWQMTPNEARILEDRDTIDGGDFLSGPANGAIFDPVNGEFFIPGQKPPSQADPDDANENAQGNEDQAATEGVGPDTGGNGDGNTTPAQTTKPAKPAKSSKATARLTALANSAVERILRKESKGGPDARFVAELLHLDAADAEAYVASRKELNDEQARAALIALATGEENEQA